VHRPKKKREKKKFAQEITWAVDRKGEERGKIYRLNDEEQLAYVKGVGIRGKKGSCFKQGGTSKRGRYYFPEN